MVNPESCIGSRTPSSIASNATRGSYEADLRIRLACFEYKMNDVLGDTVSVDYDNSSNPPATKVSQDRRRDIATSPLTSPTQKVCKFILHELDF